MRAVSPYGAVPFGGVGRVDGPGGPIIDFGRAEPGRTAPGPMEPGTGEGILSLACCTFFDEESKRKVMSVDAMLGLAKRSGPLFGVALAEHAADWADAVKVAELGVAARRAVNGDLPPSALDDLGVEKWVMRSPDTGESISLVMFSCHVGGAYRDAFQTLPVMVRSEEAGRWHYGFAVRADEDVVTFSAFELSHEMAMEDYWAMRASVGGGRTMDELASANLGGGEGEDGFGFARGSSYVGSDGTLGDQDAGTLATLVQSIVAMHVSAATLDATVAGTGTGFLVFPCPLAWMWYDFSCAADRVGIGFCQQCGRPFPLIARHGRKRRFCSRSCKTKGANKSRRHRVARARGWFEKGWCVARIATELSMDEGEVRAALSSWPKLKQALDRSIDSCGMGESPLLARCREEGLDLERLLHVRHAPSSPASV